jgi:dihydroorotate dehydrogenase (fumarate)
MSNTKRDLRTQYLGLEICSPILVGACPLTLKPESVREFAIAGAGAVVLPSLFEEQVVHEQLARGKKASPPERFIESVRYEEVEDRYNGGVDRYLESIARVKHSTSLPVIASLNGCTGGEWLRIISEMENAGADALEVTLEPDHLNASLDAAQSEQRMLKLVSELCDLVNVPVAVKVSFFHSNLANLAWRLTECGASGIVCFAYDPSWKILRDHIRATPSWDTFSGSNVNTTVSGLIRVRGGGPAISVAASGGINTPEDVIMTVLAGADVAMVTSEIYRVGPEAITHLLEGVGSYLENHQIDSYQALRESRPQPKLRAHDAYLPYLTEEMAQPPQQTSTVPKVGDRWGHVHK